MVFEVFTDALGHHLWRLRRKSGETVIAVSAHAYASREDCLQGVQLVVATSAETPVLTLDSPPTS